MNYKKQYSTRVTNLIKAERQLLNAKHKIIDKPFNSAVVTIDVMKAKVAYDDAFNKWLDLITVISFYNKNPDDSIGDDVLCS